jgi:DNA helicase-2/ATP-dependent DNA helicase PcrA
MSATGPLFTEEPPEGASDADADGLLIGLNAEQLHAVTTDGMPLAIRAGAGSGKTRVLTRRIAWRSQTGRHDPRRVLALTFTRKAAGQLRSRLRSLGLRDQVAAGTFHSVAYAQLRTYWSERNQREPELLASKYSFVTPLLPRDRRSTDALDVVSEIEWAKARRIPPEAYAGRAEALGRTPPMPPSTIARIYREYEDKKAKERKVDFDDLLGQCARALRGDRAFGDAQRWRFRHLYVDEFQDVNPLQFALLSAWLADSDDLCVVGDPDQAIYGWNGADADHLNRFDTHFPGATVVDLRQNYRSTPQVLRTAAAVLHGRTPMEANRPSGPPPTVTVYANDRAEAAAVARLVRDTRGPDGAWSRQAVLVRTNAQADVIVGALREAGIPARTRAGSGLLDRPDVKGALGSLSRSRRPLTDHLGDLQADADQDVSGDDAAPRDTERAAAFAQLRTLADEYLALDPTGTGSGFVGWAYGQARAAVDDSADAVEVATFHAAKGLEWEVVHVAGLEHGLVPIAHAREPAALAEERRLLYVALSRAEVGLHLSWAQQRTFGNRTSKRRPSFWLEDLELAISNLDKPFEQAEQARQAAMARARITKTGLPDHPVVEQLRTWRLERARAADVPAYAIFNDATLADLLHRWPGSSLELLAVSGIGPVKADRFGNDLLAILGRHERPATAAPPAPPPRAKAPPVDHGDLDLGLVEALRAWRLEHTDGKPAYTVFSNATMEELAATRPTTTDELLAVSGIGPAKAERFGAELLAFLADRG